MTMCMTVGIAYTAQAAITAWSLLLWIPRFIKYEVVPVQLRYVVWLLLQPLQGLQKQLHRQLVLRGAIRVHSCET